MNANDRMELEAYVLKVERELKVTVPAGWTIVGEPKPSLTLPKAA